MSPALRSFDGWFLVFACALFCLSAGCSATRNADFDDGRDSSGIADARVKMRRLWECSDDSMCAARVPICDVGAGVCSACATNEECDARDAQFPVCGRTALAGAAPWTPSARPKCALARSWGARTRPRSSMWTTVRARALDAECRASLARV